MATKKTDETTKNKQKKTKKKSRDDLVPMACYARIKPMAADKDGGAVAQLGITAFDVAKGTVEIGRGGASAAASAGPTSKHGARAKSVNGKRATSGSRGRGSKTYNA